MRVVAGKFKGHRLANLGKVDIAARLRPTTDRLRETFFNILANGKLGNVVSGARVLDLFAGTGALGIEAISRGAHSATLIDNGRDASQLIKKNVVSLGNPKNILFLRLDATRLPPNHNQPYTLIFLDPPYGKRLCQKVLHSIKLGGWLDPHAIILCEENIPVSAPNGFQLIDNRKFGGTCLTLLRHSDWANA